MVAGKYYLTDEEVEIVCSALFDRMCNHVDTEYVSRLTEPMYLAIYMLDAVLLCDMALNSPKELQNNSFGAYAEKIQATHEIYCKNLLRIAYKDKERAELYARDNEPEIAEQFKQDMYIANAIVGLLSDTPMDAKTFEKYQELKEQLTGDGVSVDRFIEYRKELEQQFPFAEQENEMEER